VSIAGFITEFLKKKILISLKKIISEMFLAELAMRLTKKMLKE